MSEAIRLVTVGTRSRLAEAAGVDLALLGEVVRHSDRITGGPGSVMLRPTAAPLSPDDGLHDIFVHTCGLGEKDLGLAIDLGESLGRTLRATGEVVAPQARSPD